MGLQLWSAFIVQRMEELLETKTNSLALVRERTIPTELPPLVEVSANFCG
jgi:hypothetical protein